MSGIACLSMPVSIVFCGDLQASRRWMDEVVGPTDHRSNSGSN